MANTMTNASIDPALDSVGDAFDAGILEIRTGSAPGANQAPTGTVLASITLPATAFAAASGKTKAKAGTWQDASADASGTAGHYRIKQSGDAGTANETDERIEGTITATSGGGDIELDSVSISSGQTVTITGYNLTGAAS